MAVEDFGGKVLERPIEIVNADHQNKPDVASNIARQWYDVDKVDAIMELTTSSVALAVQQLSREKKKIDIVTGAATTDLTGKHCSPYGFHWAYDTRALAVGTGGALVEQGGDTWFFLTADYAFGHSLEEDTGRYVKSKGGKVLGAVRHPLSASRLLVLPAPGAGLEGQGHRPRQRRPRHLERHQAGGRVRHRAGRAAPRGAPVHPRRGARPRPPGGAGPRAHGGLLLGPRRPEPRRSPSASWSAPDACRTWSRPAPIRRFALPQGRAGGRNGRDRGGREETEGDAGRRLLRPQRQGPRRTAAWCTRCTCSRSRRRPTARLPGTTTSTSRRSRATKPSPPCRRAAAT